MNWNRAGEVIGKFDDEAAKAREAFDLSAYELMRANDRAKMAARAIALAKKIADWGGHLPKLVLIEWKDMAIPAHPRDIPRIINILGEGEGVDIKLSNLKYTRQYHFAAEWYIREGDYFIDLPNEVMEVLQSL